jgi:hypothetical protein
MSSAASSFIPLTRRRCAEDLLHLGCRSAFCDHAARRCAVVVSVIKVSTHPFYKIMIKKRRKYMAHDELDYFKVFPNGEGMEGGRL